MVKIKELRTKSHDALRELLFEKKSRVDELHFLLRQKKIKNVKELSAVRKDIARIYTVLRENNYEKTGGKKQA